MLQLHILFADLGISRIPFLIRAVCIPHVQLVSRLQYVEHVFEEGVLFEKQAVVTHEVERIAVCIANLGFEQDARNARREVGGNDGVCIGVLSAIGRIFQCC